MSAPVVRCVIGIPPDGKARRHVIAAEYATTVREGDLPALAVPDALWGQLDFIESARIRYGLQHGWPNLNQCAALLAAVHAELHSRACGAA
jgi:hypothetical protein